MADKETILTAEGLAKLEAELDNLVTVKRVANSERIKSCNFLRRYQRKFRV
jgi:transcription elongation factor GreA